MAEFIDLEPVPSEDLSVTSVNGKVQQKNIQARQEDIRVLTEVMPDLRYNELNNRFEWGPRTKPIILMGDDLDQLTVRLAVEHDVYIPEARIKAAVKYAAKTNKYCPIKRYLLECSYKGEEFPQWDTLGQVLLGSDQPLATLGLQRFLIGAVARAYDPGCTMSWMPILIGAQGCGKSQLIRELVPENLFAEITVNIDVLMKEMYRLHVAWVTELPEVDNYFNVHNIENFKNLVTTRADEVRFPYQSLPLSLARRFVLAGTSNRSEIFVDPTGNRRFLPLEIPIGFETPWRDMKKIRHQLWTSAMKEYEKGTEWELRPHEIRMLHNYIQQFNISDPWEEMIGTYIASKNEVTIAEVLTYALSFNPQSATRRDSLRASSVLTQLGWRKTITTREGKSVRLWKRDKTKMTETKGLVDF